LADTSDVETVLVALASTAVYPNGTASPSIAATLAQLTSAASIGATSISVSSAVGLYPEIQIELYGGTAELATVSSAYEIGSTAVPLAAPPNVETWTGLVNNHASGSTVTWNDEVKLFRGWPVSADLDADLTAGLANISIFPPPGLERNTTRYPRQKSRLAKPVHTLTANVSGNTITVGGTVATPQNVIALCGTKFAFPYSVQANDTLATIATNLAALIATQFPGTSATGTTINVAGNPGILRARIASTAQVATEQSLQEKTYWITCWCPTPAMRDILAPAIDVALKQLNFMVVGTEQSRARIRYARSNTSDEGQKVQIYRRDLVYTVEFGTFTILDAFETGAIGVGVNSGATIFI
jgi:hypothetical protein